MSKRKGYFEKCLQAVAKSFIFWKIADDKSLGQNSVIWGRFSEKCALIVQRGHVFWYLYYYNHYFTSINNPVLNSWNNYRFVTIVFHYSFRIFINRYAGQGRPDCKQTCCANTKTSLILHFQISYCLHCFIKPIIQCHIGVISNWYAFIFEKSTVLGPLCLPIFNPAEFKSEWENSRSSKNSLSTNLYQENSWNGSNNKNFIINVYLL